MMPKAVCSRYGNLFMEIHQNVLPFTQQNSTQHISHRTIFGFMI